MAFNARPRRFDQKKALLFVRVEAFRRRRKARRCLVHFGRGSERAHLHWHEPLTFRPRASEINASCVEHIQGLPVMPVCPLALFEMPSSIESMRLAGQKRLQSSHC
jgi:hypothetical protein